MVRFVLTSIAFRGSKPKLLCSERISPRTATIEEVTSTAQIAICTTSNRSRTVIRRPTLPLGSRLDDLVRIGSQHLPHRNDRRRETRSPSQKQSDQIDLGIRVHGNVEGRPGKGCHTLSRRNSATLPRSPLRLRQAKSARLR